MKTITTQSSKERQQHQGPGSMSKLEVGWCFSIITKNPLSPTVKYFSVSEWAPTYQRATTESIPAVSQQPITSHTYSDDAGPHNSNITFLISINGCFETTFKVLNQISSQMSNNICYTLTIQHFPETIPKKDVTADVNASFLFRSRI